MDKYIGRMLDGRYEILEEIGRGGMAVVYRARCHRLNRYVAVKILKEEFSRDEDFRRRFYAESQAVAMLSHPNIVAVYDVNHSDDIDYIVMELIDGLTLKQYMQQRGTLSWREALHFATQIAKALEHAHSRGIIHRDIKPQNIMILKDGSVKVADFGIAHLNSQQNTLTREALGSVHYISPEQAKGAAVDARSDLYSLGVVMYEMLTGRTPYNGDSPVAIAIQHINATPVPPRRINPSIPLGLQQITLHAMCADITARYSSASAMVEDLEALRKNPKVVFRFGTAPGETTTYLSGSRPQRVPSQLGTTQSQAGQRQAVPTQNAQQAARQKARTMAERSAQQADRGGTTYTSEVREAEDEEEKTSKGVIIAIILLIAAVAAAFIFILLPMLSGTSADSETVTVPSFLGQDIQTVLASNAYSDFTLLEGDSVYNDDYAEGLICAQSVPQGQEVEEGTTITLTASKGAATGLMPDLRDSTQAEVESAIQALNLDLRLEYSFENDDSVAEGNVISTNPAAGSTISRGDTITVTISAGEGEKTVPVPDLIGLDEADAVSLLQTLNLTASVTEAEHEEDAGTVYYQSIKANSEVPEGTVVSIKVSTGKEEEPEESESPSPSETPTATATVVPSPTPTPVEPAEPAPVETEPGIPEGTEDPAAETTPETTENG